MNDDTDKPLNPVGDAALEARITAWVLGEASPFEAAELEEICARDPEARLFERRMRVLHGFITEDRKAGPEDEWKLPVEKRAKIEALFEKAVVLKEEDREQPKIVQRGQTGRRALLALAACTVISAAAWTLLGTVGVSYRKSSVAAMRMEAPQEKVDFLPGGGGGGFGGGVGAGLGTGLSDDSLADNAPASPAVTSRSASPMADRAPAAQPPADVDSLAAIESAAEAKSVRGDVVDESLAKLSEEPATRRSKSSAAGPPVKKPASSYMHLAQNAPFTTKPAPAAAVAPAETPAPTTAPATATGGVALNDFADRGGLGLDASGDRDGKPANMDADGANRFARLSGGGAVDAPIDMQARLRGEALSADGGAPLGGPVAGERPMEPGLAGARGGRIGGGGGPEGAIAPPVSGPAAVPFVGGLFSTPEQAPAGSAGLLTDASKGGLKEDFTLQINGSVTNGATFFDVEGAGKKEQAQRALGANAMDKDASLSWFGRDEGTKSLADSEVAKDKGAIESASALHGLDGLADTGTAVSGKPADGYSGLAQKEMIRRQSAVATSDKLREEAREAQAKGDLKQAVDKLKESEGVLPDAAMVDDRRAEVMKQLAEASVELGEQYRKVGKYDEASALAKDALNADPSHEGGKRLQSYLEDPIRTNPALGFESGQQSDELRRKLYIAEGNYNLGKFDDANKAYEDALRLDPYNKAARRGMEQVAQARSDYYKAAYDQTRSQLLAEVDRAWELSVPPVEQDASKDLKKRGEAEVDLSSLTKSADTPAELLPKVEKAIREGEERLLRDPNSTEVQGQLQALGKVRENLRDKIETDAKGGKMQEQNKAPVPVLPSETLTSAEPFSTFSLHVSDASFKMAKAALDRGEVPAADGIRPEEFYNAFDFGDPAPANGEPVVCAVEQSAHPALPQRNLLRIGVKTGSQGRGGSTPLNLTLLLDSSGSMEREDRNAGLANAVKQLSGLLKEGDTVSVIGFARQPRLLVDRLPGNRAQELNAIFAQTPPEGGTNLEEGIKLGEELAMRQFNPAAQNRIVLFTDGAANLGDAKPETLQAKVEHMRQNGIAFDAAGFGTDGLNDKLLERLTRNGNGRYYIVDRAEDADASFAKQLAGAFRPAAENVKVQVRFNPARVAKYKLIGFEEHRLKKEDFRNDAVDAAEMAAEEAGNALYQIEALPQGEGEVGEVSVRFRDAASGQMVERTWTIPYEAQTPSFDQATPSIQLAGLAAFAAEKLRAAPMADAIDFQHLAPVMAKVKARYASSKPVAELEAMIGKLK
jgi:tetratricopeptide (TPR) repeat protein